MSPGTYRLVIFQNSSFHSLIGNLGLFFTTFYILLIEIPPSLSCCFSQVRPFPRRAFGEAENELSLIELGLTSKQEALFLELI